MEMTREAKKRAALYSRVSSREQTEGYSLDAQLEAMRGYAQSDGYHVVAEYVDGGYTGRSDNRPQFKSMIADAQAGLFDVVIVHKLDRFARSREHSIIYKALLRKIGIPVLSVTEPMDPNSPASIITEGMLEVLGEWYSANLGQEVRKGRTKGAKLGKWMGGFVKFGYKVDEKGYYAVDESEAKHVLSMFEKADSGMTLGRIVKWLHAAGIPSKCGGRWSRQRVSELLRDTTYIGRGLFNKKMRRGNKLVRGEAVSVPFPPVIPEDLFNRVQARLAQNKKQNGGGAKRFYVLQHLGRCGECGGSLRCHTVKEHRYLGCGRQLTYPEYEQCYTPKHWKLDVIEQHIWEEMEGVLAGYVDNAYGSLIEQFELGQHDRQQAIAKAKDEVKRSQTGRERILTVLRKGYITQADAEIQLTAINADEKYWQQELANIQRLETDSHAVWQAFMSQLQELDRFRFFGFDNLSAIQKRELLNTLLKEFVLYRDGKIELRFKLPIDGKQIGHTISTLSSDIQICQVETAVTSNEAWGKASKP